MWHSTPFAAGSGAETHDVIFRHAKALRQVAQDAIIAFRRADYFNVGFGQNRLRGQRASLVSYGAMYPFLGPVLFRSKPSQIGGAVIGALSVTVCRLVSWAGRLTMKCSANKPMNISRDNAGVCCEVALRVAVRPDARLQNMSRLSITLGDKPLHSPLVGYCVIGSLFNQNPSLGHELGYGIGKDGLQ